MEKTCKHGVKEYLPGHTFCVKCRYSEKSHQELHEKQQLDVFEHIQKQIFNIK